MVASQGKGMRGCRGVPAPGRAPHWRLLPMMTALFLLAACAGASPQATLPAGQAMPQPTAAPGTPPLAHGGELPLAPSLTLTIWGPDSMAPLDDVPGGNVLATQFDAFARTYPGSQVRYVRKKPHGQGGVVHFLRSTAAVAPETLPDLALVDMREVGLLAESGLLQPLEALLEPSLTTDLAPFARQAGEVDGHLFAVQYGADLRFLAYNSALVASPPSTWSELIETGLTCLLPIGASEGAVVDAFLPHYLALGGKLVDRDGQPYLDETVVAAILEAYAAAIQAGVLSPTGLELDRASDCWPIYLASAGGGAEYDVAMTSVTSWDYGRERTRLASTFVAPLPTLSGTPTSMASGWGWVLISKDARRQAAAATFLRAILQPEAMASWSQATYHLPTRLSALSMAVDDEDYMRFLQRLMRVASPQPPEPAYSLAAEALGPAIESVAQGALSPEAAASAAAGRVRATLEQMRTNSQP